MKNRNVLPEAIAGGLVAEIIFLNLSFFKLHGFPVDWKVNTCRTDCSIKKDTCYDVGIRTVFLISFYIIWSFNFLLFSDSVNSFGIVAGFRKKLTQIQGGGWAG